VIIEVDDASDERLNAFRWRERQLNTIAQRKAAQVNNLESNGMFVAEGDLVVRRALEAGCKPSVVLCDPKCAQEFAADVSKQGGITLSASADIRREVTGLGVPLDAIGVFHRPALRDAQSLIDSSTRLVILDCIDNPSNVGADPKDDAVDSTQLTSISEAPPGENIESELDMCMPSLSPVSRSLSESELKSSSLSRLFIARLLAEGKSL
jgi:hypothetical protein